MACYTPDVRAFDAIMALQFKGADAYRQHWQACFAMMPDGEMLIEAHEVEISVAGDLAIAHFLQRCGCTDADGNTQSGWMRATVCGRRTADGWRIAHEHYSAPFAPETMMMVEATP
jgi:ketosteroid isomerase-like protein